jgi:hypothetical protein
MNTNTKNQVIVIHHSADFDGLFCREIARKHFGDQAEYIGWDYGYPVPTVSPDAALFMLDISVEGLMDHPHLRWIDHHKSAMDKYGTLPGYQIDGVAACRLAWQYFNACSPSGGLPTKEDFVSRSVTEPWAVRLAGEYDIWDRRDPDAELFQHGLRSRNLDQDWGSLLTLDEKLYVEKWGNHDVLNSDGSVKNGTVRALLESGRAVQYAKTEENRGIITSYGFDVDFEGLKFLACNHARFNSHLFTAGIRPEHDALLGFNWDGSQWRISLYHAPGKESHDLSLIAVKHGGGGHRGACGFRLKTLPFLP